MTSAVDRLEPELRQPDEDQRVGDEAEEERAEGGADERAGAAEDVHAADDDRGHDREHDAGRGRPVDRSELDDPHHAGDARQQAAHRERDEHDEPGRDPEDRRRLGVAADRVDLPPEARLAQDDRPDRHDDDRDR